MSQQDITIEELPLSEKEKINAKRLMAIKDTHKSLKDFLSKFSRGDNDNSRLARKIVLKEFTKAISQKLHKDFAQQKKEMEAKKEDCSSISRCNSSSNSRTTTISSSDSGIVVVAMVVVVVEV